MKKLQKLLQQQFDIMCATGNLFIVDIPGSVVWDMYLISFIHEDDPIFRDPESTKHNCNHCNNFIRRYGNVVAIDENYRLITLFDVICDDEYRNSMKSMDDLIRGNAVKDVFFETFDELNSLPYEKCTKDSTFYKLGVDQNHKRYTKAEAEVFGVVKENEIRTFDHFSLSLPTAFVDKTGNSIESIMAVHRSAKDVFQRAMVEISSDTLQLVKDLIVQGSLLNGEAHVSKIDLMIVRKLAYDNLAPEQRDNWCWMASHKLGIAKFKNELIGVLCTELAQGEEINKACQSWNKRVDPANYMKAVAPITENQKRMAQDFVEANGYVQSFNRRLAILDDIKADEIKHINSGDGAIEEVSIFDSVKTSNSRHKRNEFKGVEEVGIDKFLSEILPNCSSVEAFLENSHEGNLVTMTTARIDCKPIFKWSNYYSWTYKGNLAGKSMIKQAVKSQGGKVDGVLRFSIMWSEGNSTDNSDLDAHCIEPKGFKIHFKAKVSSITKGNLDIDIRFPKSHKTNGREVVENITYPRLDTMSDGIYKLFVRQFSNRGSTGFKAEIEFNGELHEYSYNREVRGDIQVAEVTLKNGVFSIVHKLSSTSSSKELYGLDTQQFHKVDLVCLSPNHWGNNKAGNKHYFFMLNKCKADSNVRSFHNENLEPELAKHRKVLEVLGAMNTIEPDGKQLSGIGFNATVRDEVILRLKGSFKRVIKLKF